MLDVNHLSVRRDGREILHIDALHIDARQFTVILGHNGSGKSTLLKILARQLKPDAGAVLLNGKNLNHTRQRTLAQWIGYLPQHLPPVADLTVRELVQQGRFAWRGHFGRWRAEDDALLQAAMADTGMTHCADHSTDTLSGGERQRAWIAMLLAQQSPLLLLDEPTSALDPAHQYELMTLLRRLNQNNSPQAQQRGVVIILHDINLATRYADRIIALKQGHVIFDGAPRQLLSPAILNTLYGIETHIVPHPSQDIPLAVIG